MKTLTLEHLAPYLPYGLKFIDSKGTIFEMDGLFKDLAIHFKETNRLDYFHFCPQIKPILRPLSDLAKEIEHNGEKFVPIVELAKIHGVEFDIKQIKNEFNTIVCYSEITLHPTDNTPFARDFFELDLEDCCFDFGFEIFGIDATDIIETSFFPVRNQLKLFNKLFELHFDVFGLIEQGLAIDINTLEK